MTLVSATRGDQLQIVDIPDEQMRSQAIRFGIGEGAEVVVLQNHYEPVIRGLVSIAGRRFGGQGVHLDRA